MEEQTTHVRTALMPLCYKDFRCLAGACRDSCCDYNWEISFNKKDYLRIKRSAKSPELKELLSQGMSRMREKEHDGMYAQFKMDEAGRCQFQTVEGLCRLQLECGEETLPLVCKLFPRKHVYTPAARESSLSPACEGVLALLWDLPQGIDFWEEPLPKQDWRQVEMTASRWVHFADIRSFCIDVLQERSLRMSQRMLMLGLLLQKLRDTDWEDESEVDRWLAWSESRLRDPSAAAALDRLPRDQLNFLTGNIRVLMELYQKEPAKKEIYRELFTALSAEEWNGADFGKFSIDALRYHGLEGRLEELLGHPDYFFENLMVMTAFYQSFPDLLKPDGMWKGYIELCVLYSFFRFASVCGCYKEVSRERLFQVLSSVSRGLLHNAGRRDKLLNELFEKNSASLAHMAMLIGV